MLSLLMPRDGLLTKDQADGNGVVGCRILDKDRILSANRFSRRFRPRLEPGWHAILSQILVPTVSESARALCGHVPTHALNEDIPFSLRAVVCIHWQVFRGSLANTLGATWYKEKSPSASS